MTVTEFFDVWRRKQAGYPCRFEGHKFEKTGETADRWLVFDIFTCRVCGEQYLAQTPPEHVNCRCYVNLPQIKGPERGIAFDA